MDSTGFRKLKIAVATGAMAGMLAGAGTARKATAAVMCDGATVTGTGTCNLGDLDIITAGASWEFSDTTSGPFTAEGFGIDDASLTVPERGDAYDGAFILAVNGIIFADPSGIVDYDAATNTVTSRVQSIGGLDVHVEYFVSSEDPVIRVQYVFSNPTNRTIAATASVGNNLGSNGDTQIAATSNGNTTLDRTDRWLVTIEDDTDPDPVLTFSRFGRSFNRLTVNPPAVFEAPGAAQILENGEQYSDLHEFSVRRGKTARLLVFGALSEDVATAVDFGETFESFQALDAAGLLDGLSNSERREVVNYGVKALPR